MAITLRHLSLCLIASIAFVGIPQQHATAQQSGVPVKPLCFQAMDMALNDADVRELFLQRIQSDVIVLSKIECLPYPGPEKFHYVHFDFDCAPGIHCLIDPGLLVVVDTRRQLVRIVDEWYSPSGETPGTILRMLEKAAKMTNEE